MVVQGRIVRESMTATSSAEAEFLAAVLTAKQAKHLRSILKELGFEQPGPTPLCCDNQSAVNMANAGVPTGLQVNPNVFGTSLVWSILVF